MGFFGVGGEGAPRLTTFLGREDVEMGLENRIITDARKPGRYLLT
jgi:hypothetical protein